MTQQEFNAAYWASVPPELRKTLFDKPAEATELAMKGFIVDAEIMVYGFTPYYTMWLRQQQGYTWYPNAIQPPVMVAPGLFSGSVTPYDPNTPPKGSIKVSLDLKDYPPFDPPAPPPPPPDHTDPVLGESMPGSGVYGVASWFIGKNGDRIDNTRGKFQLVVAIQMVGQPTRIFRKVE